MKHIKKMKVDIDKKNFEIIPSVQYDSNTRFLHINLLNGAVPFNLTGCSVKISGTKQDGTAIFNNCTIISEKEGFVEVELTEQMNAVSGTLKCELKIYSANGVLTTKQFSIDITSSVTSKEITSGNEFKALTDALKVVQGIDNKADKEKVEEKFGEVYEQLDEKLNKDGIVTMANMGQDVKEAMTGGSVAVVGEDTILTSNIVNGQVTNEKTSFYSDINLYNYKDALDGKLVRYSDGVILDNLNHSLSDYIKVTTGNYIKNFDGPIVLYNKNKVYIKGVNEYSNEGGVANTVFNVTEDGFVRFTIKYHNQYKKEDCVFKRGIINKYSPYGGYVQGVDVKNTQNKILPKGIEEFDYFKYLKYCSFKSDGSINENGSYFSIFKMPVTKGEKILVQNTVDIESFKRIIYYDSNGVIKKIDTLQDFKNNVIIIEEGISSLSINLISQLGDISKRRDIKIYKSSETDSFYIDNINGFKLSILGVTQGSITSSRDASQYGFLPSASGDENRLALQTAIDSGGNIDVLIPGTYELATDSIKIGNDVTINFGAGVYIKRVVGSSGKKEHSFINKGAFTKTYNKNIRINGLKLICNGVDVDSTIKGLRGHIAGFYIKNFEINDFECLDVLSGSYCIHVCTFKNLIIDNVKIEGKKDAVHLGRGEIFRISNGLFKTYDDPIALNAHDYDTGNPELGWIKNGIIENCYDLNDNTTTGFFCRILSGSWVDWFMGMEVQKSDTVVSNNKLYRVFSNSITQKYISRYQPNHGVGSKTYNDGITWVMIQDDVTYNAACKNIHFKNIHLQKRRGTAFSIHFDKDGYSRSYYPDSIAPIQQDLIFENIIVENEIDTLISAVTPINVVKVVNSILGNNKINLSSINTKGIKYEPTNILLSGTTFKGTGTFSLVNSTDRNAKMKINNSLVENDGYNIITSDNVSIISSDI